MKTTKIKIQGFSTLDCPEFIAYPITQSQMQKVLKKYSNSVRPFRPNGREYCIADVTEYQTIVCSRERNSGTFWQHLRVVTFLKYTDIPTVINNL